jgi:hypothetical protein
MRLLEESTGQGHWHLLARTPQRLTGRVIAETRYRLERLAKRHGGEYGGWSVSTRRFEGAPARGAG